MMLTERTRLVFVFTVFAVGLFDVAGRGQVRDVNQPPRAVVLEIGHDFGPIERGGRLAHTFTIRNTGAGPLNILRVDYSQPGMRSSFKSVVPPQEVGEITIEWDTTPASGGLDAQATVHLNDPKKPRVTFTLTGVVGQSIALQPSPDVFFNVFQDQTLERHVTIVNNEDRPLAITGLRRTGEHFTADITAVQPGKRYDVLIRVPSGQTPGRYFETLDVDTDHPRIGPVRIDVNVFVKRNMYTSPDAIDFGEVEPAAGPRRFIAVAVHAELDTSEACGHVRNHVDQHERAGTEDWQVAHGRQQQFRPRRHDRRQPCSGRQPRRHHRDHDRRQRLPARHHPRPRQDQVRPGLRVSGLALEARTAKAAPDRASETPGLLASCETFRSPALL